MGIFYINAVELLDSASISQVSRFHFKASGAPDIDMRQWDLSSYFDI